MALASLRELRRRARSRADMLIHGDVDGGIEPDYSNSFVPNEELNEHINVYAKEYYNLITQADGENYFSSTWTGTISQGTPDIELPGNFFKLQAVIYVASSTYEVKLKRASKEDFRTRNIAIPTANIKIIYTPYLNRLVDYTDWQPGVSYEFQQFVNYFGVIYRANVAHVSAATIGEDIISGKMEVGTSGPTDQVFIDGYNGLEEYIVLRAARFLRDKEEDDNVNDITTELNLVTQRIEQLKEDRDQNQADMIQDVRSDSYGYYGSTNILYRLVGGKISFVNGSAYPYYGIY